MAFLVPSEHRQVLEDIFTSGQYSAIANAFKPIENFSDPDKMASIIAKVANVSPTLGHKFLDVLISMVQTRESIGWDVSTFVDEVVNQLESENVQDSDFGSVLEEILTFQPLAMFAKSLDLRTQYERVFIKAEIVSSLRAAFTDDDKPTAFIMSHELQIHFKNAGRREMISFGMDTEDLSELISLLTRSARRGAQLDHFVESTGDSDNAPT